MEALIASELYTESLSCLREIAVKVPNWSSKNLVERTSIEKLAHECGIDFDTLWRSRPNNRGGGGGDGGDNDDSNDGEYEEEIQEEI